MGSSLGQLALSHGFTDDYYFRRADAILNRELTALDQRQSNGVENTPDDAQITGARISLGDFAARPSIVKTRPVPSTDWKVSGSRYGKDSGIALICCTAARNRKRFAARWSIVFLYTDVHRQ